MKFKRFLFVFMSVFFIGCTPAPSTEQVLKEPLPEPDSTGAKALKDFCSHCHGMPHPSTHPALEWSNVVYRMNIHRLKRGLVEMTELEKQDLIRYLQKYAADQ